MQKQWSNVDNYLIEKLIPKDDMLEQVLANNQRQGFPPLMWRPIRVSYWPFLCA
jgi:hypothetical protein